MGRGLRPPPHPYVREVILLLFISEKLKDVTVRNQREIFAPSTGRRIGMERRVNAEFRRGGIPSWALDEAVKKFQMAGKPNDVPAWRWLSWYDSETAQREHGWSDEEREAIEQKLLAKPDILLAERPKQVAPWPAYPTLTVQGRRTIEHVVQKIVEKVQEDGYDPSDIIRYERENLNRREVIDALTALTGSPEPDELVAA